MNQAPRPTRSITKFRDGTTYRLWDDGSLRHDGGHKRFGKALKVQRHREAIKYQQQGDRQ